MRVALGADHGGFAYKEEIKRRLIDKGYEIKDFGTYSQDSTDYNEYAISVSNVVASGMYDRGILVCGTGIGMSIQANKVDGVRAALVHDVFSAEQTRLHNDSNVLTMGARVIDLETAMKIVDVWLDTNFSGEERHVRRVSKIENGEVE